MLLLPLCGQARPWFWFSKRTSSVAGLALCLVAFSRASLVVLFCGENGTAVLSTELWLWALIPAWWIERQSSQIKQKSQVRSRKLEISSGKSEVGSQKSEIRSSHFVKSEVWSLIYEVLNLKSEVGSRKSEVWSWKSEVRRRKTPLGFRNLRSGSIFVSLCNNNPAGKAKRNLAVAVRKNVREPLKLGLISWGYDLPFPWFFPRPLLPCVTDWAHADMWSTSAIPLWNTWHHHSKR